MHCKRLCFLALLSIIFIFPVSSSMVCFLVVETGLSEDVPLSRFSSLWEGGLMDVFFDAGHIVTNCPITRLGKKPASDLGELLEDDYADAVEGGAEYFILCYLEHQENSATAIPISMNIKVFRTDTDEKILDKVFSAGRGRNQNEEYQLAQNAGRDIIPIIRDW